jgi:hypothetical protein
MRLIGLAYGEKAEQTWKQRALRLPSYSAAFAFFLITIFTHYYYTKSRKFFIYILKS